MKNYLRFFLIILIILNCIVIFNFSGEQSEESNKTSGRVIDTIIEINPKTKHLNRSQKDSIKSKIMKPIRKTAHFTIYMSLGILLYLCAKTYETENKKEVLISLMLAFLYACTDEIHQHFVPGRSGEFRDVCIDTCGALCGILVVFILFECANKIKNSKAKINIGK